MNHYHSSLCLLAVVLTSGLVAAQGTAENAKPTAEQVAFFESRIRPVLVEHCFKCHSATADKIKGGLSLDSRDTTRRGGERGPAVFPGKVKESLLLKAIRYEDDDLRMPPKEKLPETVIADFEKWVAQGAPDPREAGATPRTGLDLAAGRQFWSFRPLARVSPPDVRQTEWPRNEVDRFILARLEARGLKPVADADREVLLRRLTYDLTGLPPTPEERATFLADTSPQAVARVVDRLLASPAYGERWGRHWLDVIRYSDTAGDNSDYPIPQMYQYRNWVVAAFNRDLPYDQMVREQLAGDLSPATSPEDQRAKVIATGYLANTRRFGSYEDARYPWHLTIEDTIDNLGRTFLGLTINCSRCHDHKFDPISQEDYYALYGFFQSTRYPWPGIELDKVPRDLVPLASAAEVEALEKSRRGRFAELDAEIKRHEKSKADLDKALQTAEKIKDEEERKTRISETAKHLAQANARLRAARTAREAFARQPLPYETAYAVAEAPNQGRQKIGNACVQIKGDPERPGKEVPRRFPTVLGGQTLAANTPGSGRADLARWLTDAANPLTARVMVNRLWHYHFGRGIVPTPSDFGRQGQPPTHPELLDWLARRFMESGWSVKTMHRLLLLSHTYQLASADDPEGLRLDVANELLGRFPRRRLDAESIRDTLLAVSGGLDRSPGKAHPFPSQTTWDYTQHKPFKAVYEHNQRSVYLMTQRIQRHPFLGLFDGADTNASSDRRVTSTTSLQALYLMNDPFVHESARKMARRLLGEQSNDEGRLEQAYLLLFGRRPMPQEKEAARDYLLGLGGSTVTQGVSLEQSSARAWESLVRALFLSNELLYVD